MSTPEDNTDPLGIGEPVGPIGLNFEQSVELRMGAMARQLDALTKALIEMPKAVAKEIATAILASYQEQIKKLEARVSLLEQASGLNGQ